MFAVSSNYLAEVLQGKPQPPTETLPSGVVQTSQSTTAPTTPLAGFTYTVKLWSSSQVFIGDEPDPFTVNVSYPRRKASSDAFAEFLEKTLASEGICVTFKHSCAKRIEAGEHALHYEPKASHFAGQELALVLLKGACTPANEALDAAPLDPTPLATSPLLPLLLASYGHPIHIGVQERYCYMLLVCPEATLRSLQTDPEFSRSLQSQLTKSLPTHLGLQLQLWVYPALPKPALAAQAVTAPRGSDLDDLVALGNELLEVSDWPRVRNTAAALERLGTYSAMGQACIFRAFDLLERSEFEEASVVAGKAAALCRQEGLKYPLGLALSLQSSSERSLNRDSEAIRLCTEVFAIAGTLDSNSDKEDLESRAFRELAIINRRQRNGRESARYSMRDMLLTIQASNPSKIAKSSSVLALALERFGKIPACALLFQIYISYAERGKHDAILPGALVNGGVAQDRAGLHDKAIEYYKRALALGLPPDDQATAYLNIGEALERLKRLEEAQLYYDQALAVAEPLNISDLTSDILVAKAQLQELRGLVDPSPTFERCLALLLQQGVQSGDPGYHFRRASAQYQDSVHRLVRHALKSASRSLDKVEASTASQGFKHIYNYTSPVLLSQIGGHPPPFPSPESTEHCRIVYWPVGAKIHVWVQLPSPPGEYRLRYSALDVDASAIVAELDNVGLDEVPVPPKSSRGFISADAVAEAPSTVGDISHLAHTPILEMLYEALILPLHAELEEYDPNSAAAAHPADFIAPKLVIAAYGDLIDIPFASLVNPVSKQPLFYRFAICRPPSLAVFDTISARAKEPKPQRNGAPMAVVVHDVKMESAVEEASAVEAEIAKWKGKEGLVLHLPPLTPSAPTLQAQDVVEAIRSCAGASLALLHFAAHHGVQSFDDLETGKTIIRVNAIKTPEELKQRDEFNVQRSHIVLESKNEIQDVVSAVSKESILWPKDLEQLDMSHFALAFLNCCESYHGSNADGDYAFEPQNPVEPEFGFSSVLLANKVAVVVSTLWDVDCDEAKALATIFYRHWKSFRESRVDAAEALRRAQQQAFEAKLSWATLAAYSVSGLGSV